MLICIKWGGPCYFEGGSDVKYVFLTVIGEETF